MQCATTVCYVITNLAAAQDEPQAASGDEDDATAVERRAQTEEAHAAIQELKRQQHELNVKLDVERLRYQSAVEQLKHAEAQARPSLLKNQQPAGAVGRLGAAVHQAIGRGYRCSR